MDTRPGAVAKVKPVTKLPGRVVLVLQGGGALGAYQGGVYQALHEAGIEPNWVIGTSIGAINAAIIAGNASESRLDCVREFWERMEHKPFWSATPFALMAGNFATMMTVFPGLSGYFSPTRVLALGLHAAVGAEQASFYSVEALPDTLADLIDFERINAGQPRLTVG